MPDYSKIEDEHLRHLLMESESIRSRPETEIQTIIEGIAALDPAKQKEIAAVLEEEQKRVEEAKLAKGITPEMEIQEIEKNENKLMEIKHEYDNSIRKYREEKSKKEDGLEAEKILELLDNNPS